MKNLIYAYDSYKDKIFKGNPIFIDHLFFAGIKFVDKEEILAAFVNFQAITDENKIITFVSELIYDDIDEYESAKDEYGDLIAIGTANYLSIPTIMNISTFYKEKIDNSEYYTTYCISVTDTEGYVYKVKLNKESFLTLMYVFGYIRKTCALTYNDPAFIAQMMIDKDTEILKINTTEMSDIETVYINPKKICNCRVYSYSLVLKDRTDRDIRIFYSDIINKKDYKNIIKRDNVFIDKAKYVNYCIDNIRDLPEYVIELDIPVNYSITANFPMTSFSLICKKPNGGFCIMDMGADTYNTIRQKFIDFMDKK